MKNLVPMNTPYILVITRCLSLNGLIKNENMQLKVLELAFTANVVRKKINFHVENGGKNRESTISKVFKLNLTTFIFNEIGIFSRIK